MKRLLSSCLVAATTFAGCSSSDTPTEADYDDVAQALTSVVVTDNDGGEVGAMIDATSVAHGDGKLTLSLDASGKYTGSHLGLEYAYTAKCSDAEGTAQDTCDKTSDTAEVAVNWTGDLELPRLTASVMRDGSWQLSGLQSDEVTFAGDSEFSLDTEVQSLFRSATRTYRVNYSASYDDVVLSRTQRAVKSGRVTYSIDAERTASGPRGESEATFDIDGVLEFNADGSASLTLDSDHAYKLDLTTGVLVKGK
jgi:hypothetical protein